jgi:hypothetical protein
VELLDRFFAQSFETAGSKHFATPGFTGSNPPPIHTVQFLKGVGDQYLFSKLIAHQRAYQSLRCVDCSVYEDRFRLQLISDFIAVCLFMLSSSTSAAHSRRDPYMCTQVALVSSLKLTIQAGACTDCNSLIPLLPLLSNLELRFERINCADMAPFLAALMVRPNLGVEQNRDTNVGPLF